MQMRAKRRPPMPQEIQKTKNSAARRHARFFLDVICIIASISIGFTFELDAIIASLRSLARRKERYSYMQSLGLITVAASGTPVRISAASLPCDHVNFQPCKSLGPFVDNVGAIYIGLAGMNKSTGSGVLYVLKPGVPAQTNAGKTKGALFDNANNYWMDADNSGDGAQVSCE